MVEYRNGYIGRSTCVCGQRFSLYENSWVLCKSCRQERLCDGCGCSFTPRKISQKFCSVGCRPPAGRQPGGKGTEGNCERCGSAYTRAKKNQRYCGQACRLRATREPGFAPLADDVNGRLCELCGVALVGRQASRCRVHCLDKVVFDDLCVVPWRDCVDCGAKFVGYWDRSKPLCAACKQERRTARDRRKNVARRGYRPISKALIRDIRRRDGDDCGICGGAINFDVAYPDPLSRSIDHIVPLSSGGTDETSNLQLAHLRCNILRGNREVESCQLLTQSTTRYGATAA